MLDRISLAAPCSADWDSMPGGDRVRHCGQCEKEGQLCARLYRRADGTMLTSNCPEGLRAIGRGISRVAGAAMSAMMTLSSAAAQIPFFQIPTAQQQESSASVIRTVQDITRTPVAHAVVELSRNGSGEKLQAKTDESGKFLMKSLRPGLYAIRIASPGFLNFTRQISLGSREDFRIDATLEIGLLMGAVVPIVELVPVTGGTARRLIDR